MAYMGINDYSNIISNYVTPVIPQNQVQNVTELQDISTKEVAPEVKVEAGNHLEPVEAGTTFHVKNIDIHDVALSSMPRTTSVTSEEMLTLRILICRKLFPI